MDELNADLDRLNQQRGGGGTNDTTGNGISLGMKLRQLQISLDSLNNTLKSMMRRAGGGGEGGQGSGGKNDSSLYGLLGDPGKRNAQLERAKIGGEAINAGDITASKWHSSATREAFLNSPEGERYRERYEAVSE